MKSINPKVSIIIPLYNQERYFDACMRSVTSQSYLNLDIIVVNDGSTDKSMQIAQKWSKKDGRVRVLDKKNEGAAYARRDGLMVANGELIAFVDSDDTIPREAIERLTNCLVRHEVDVVIGSMARKIGPIIQKHYSDVGSFPYHKVVSQPELYDKYYLNFFGKSFFSIMTTACLFRKNAFDRAMSETSLFSDKYRFVGDDHFLFMKLFPYLKSMYRTDETVYNYRYGGQSSDRFSPTYPALFDLADERYEILKKLQLSEGYGPLFRQYAYSVYFYAQQLIQYRKADRMHVLSFLKEELSKRKLFRHMIEYFADYVTDDKPVNLMLNSDYEGMYDFVYSKVVDQTKSLKGIIRRLTLSIFR